ncbi:MAG: phage protease [Pseudomonadota bacterium]
MVDPMAKRITVTANAFGAPLEAEAPEWIELIPTGSFRLQDGRGTYQITRPEQLIAESFRAAGDTKLMIDVAHATDHGAWAGDLAAAGWMAELAVRDGRIWARVEWTEKGQELIEKRLFRRISPTFIADEDSREVVRILRAGLVNDPAIPQLKPLAASMERTMDPQTLEALGLSADATPEEVAEATRLMVAEHDAANARLAQIAASVDHTGDVDDAAVTKICASIKAPPDPKHFVPMATVQELQAEMADMRKVVDGVKAEKITASVDRAVAAGKIPPALRDHYEAIAEQDPDAFDALVKDMQPVVTAGRTLAVTPERKEGELTPEQLKMAAACGVSPEAFAKTQKVITAANEARQ